MTSFKSVTSKSLGKLVRWEKTAHGIEGSTDQGRFRVTAYTDQMIRIAITQEDFFEDFSYAVVATPQVTPALQEQPEHLVLSTASVRLVISRNPVRFSFQTSTGQIINEDDTFGTSWNGDQVTTYKKLQPGERFLGLGEKTGPLDRRGHGYQNWNTDSYAYSTGSDPLYCSTPFYLGIHQNICYGIYLDNSHKTFFNFGASNDRFASFSADTGEMNYYLIHGTSVRSIIQEYTHLTGRMEMPPLWSIGYQQCRYSYYPDKEVLTLAQTFREKEIPADTIVLDIHYMEAYKIFTWSKRDFPDPKGMLDKLRALGFHVVVMCDPGIKKERGYATYDDGIKQDVFIKYPDGTPYTGQVWPGWCHFPDFTKPETRDWWREQLHAYVDMGVEGFWNDMNEIATWGHMLPENIEMDFEGNRATTRRGRNLYGFQMARSTYEGTKALMNGKRPFNLTRSGFSGVQRYAAVWTGDNVAYDEHMMLGVRMVNSLGLTGVAFAGYDVGGFVGDASTKLFTRWVSIGAFSPFFRGHTMINTRDSEPWSYGEEAEQIARNYIRFRYRLLPYIYSLFYDAASTGMPVQRSLAIEYPFHHKVYDGQFQHQYLFGPSLMVVPVESSKDFVKVFLPEGEWYSLYDGRRTRGEQEIIVEAPVHRLPVFVKSGAIIPMQDNIAHTGLRQDTMQIHLYIGDHNTDFTFFEDDGESYQYQQGNYALRQLVYQAQASQFTIEAQQGSFAGYIKRWQLVIHGLPDTYREIRVNGTTHTLERTVNRFFAALQKFDPIHDPEPAPQEDVHLVTFNNIAGQITCEW
jgi:alpha-glucosidase